MDPLAVVFLVVIIAFVVVAAARQLGWTRRPGADDGLDPSWFGDSDGSHTSNHHQHGHHHDSSHGHGDAGSSHHGTFDGGGHGGFDGGGGHH